MRRKKLKALFSVLVATLVIAGVNYNIDNNIKVAYGAEAESQVESDIKVEVTYYNKDSANSIDPVISITNNSDKKLDLQDLNLKYFGSYGDNNECVCYYAGTNNGKYKNLSSGVKASINDKYLNIDFTKGTLDTNQSMSMQMNVHKRNWSNYKNIDKSLFKLGVFKDGVDKEIDVETNKNLVMPEVSIAEMIKEGPDDIDGIKVIENGNKFLGIEGLEEGKDYTCKRIETEDNFEDIITLNKEFANPRSGSESCMGYTDFYLNFENNIRKVIGVSGFPMPGIDFFDLTMDKAKGKRGEYIKVPITLSTLWEGVNFDGCSFTLKYDTDVFEDAYIEKDDSLEKFSKNNKEKGLVSVSYLPYETLKVKEKQKVFTVDLILKIKDDALIGSTLLTVESASAEATDERGYECYDCVGSGASGRGSIDIEK